MSDMSDDHVGEMFAKVLGKACENCKHWEPLHFDNSIGNCERPFDDQYKKIRLTTTDLTVCSKWEQKDDE